jgi:hypothetical protein
LSNGCRLVVHHRALHTAQTAEQATEIPATEIKHRTQDENDPYAALATDESEQKR